MDVLNDVREALDHACQVYGLPFSVGLHAEPIPPASSDVPPADSVLYLVASTDIEKEAVSRPCIVGEDCGCPR
jgi:hypothetical protein